MNATSFEVMWKEYNRLRKRSIVLMGAMAAYIADNRNAKLSLRAQQALAAFSPSSIKGRVLDILTEYEQDWPIDELLKQLNAPPGHQPATIANLRGCVADLERDGYVVRVKVGVYRAVADEDADGVRF